MSQWLSAAVAVLCFGLTLPQSAQAVLFTFHDGSMVQVRPVRQEPELYRFDFDVVHQLKIPLDSLGNQLQVQRVADRVRIAGRYRLLSAPFGPGFQQLRARSPQELVPSRVGEETDTFPFLVQERRKVYLLVFEISGASAPSVWRSEALQQDQIDRVNHHLTSGHWTEASPNELQLKGKKLWEAPPPQKVIAGWFASEDAQHALAKRHQSEPDEAFWDEMDERASRGFTPNELQELADQLDSKRYPLIRPFLEPGDLIPVHRRNARELRLLTQMKSADLLRYAALNLQRVFDLMYYVDRNEVDLMPLPFLKSLAAAADHRILRRLALGKIGVMRQMRLASEIDYLRAVLKGSQSLSIGDQADRAELLLSEIAAIRFEEVRDLFRRVIAAIDSGNVDEIDIEPRSLRAALWQRLEDVGPGPGLSCADLLKG